jgi:DNA-binding NarL/FixJ family response regulator
MTNPTRILIVDDHAMVRLGLAKAILGEDDLVLVGEAADGPQAIELYRELRPDVVTMDYKLPLQNGIECTAAICQEFPDARVILLSIHEGDEDIWRATRAGARGYVAKTVEIAEILAAIRQVARGEMYYSAGLAEKIVGHPPIDMLSPKELQVLRLIAAGRGNKEIADILQNTPTRIRSIIEHILDKLQVKDRTQAATAAIQRGILHLDSQ